MNNIRGRFRYNESIYGIGIEESSSSSSSVSSSSSSSSVDCYLPPIPNVTLIDQTNFTVTSPSDVPEGITVSLLMRDITLNGDYIMLTENLGASEEFELGSAGFSLIRGHSYGFVWRVNQ